MSPRIIYIPLSGGDRKAQAKARREARNIASGFWQRSVQARAIGEAKIREADQLACDAWTSRTFWAEPTDRSPTIAQAINGSRPLLWAKCKKCGHEPMIDLRKVDRPPDTRLHQLEPELFRKACSKGRKSKVGADLLGVRSDDDDPEPGRQVVDG
jgi:hypothetical protein